METPPIDTPDLSASADTGTPAPTPATPSADLGDGGNSGSSNVIESMANEKPMDWKSMLVFSLIIVASIYSIVYHKKAIKKLEDGVSNDEFLNLADEVDEVKYNVKKALGKRYKTTS